MFSLLKIRICESTAPASGKWGQSLKKNVGGVKKTEGEEPRKTTSFGPDSALCGSSSKTKPQRKNLGSRERKKVRGIRYTRRRLGEKAKIQPVH